MWRPGAGGAWWWGRCHRGRSRPGASVGVAGMHERRRSRPHHGVTRHFAHHMKHKTYPGTPGNVQHVHACTQTRTRTDTHTSASTAHFVTLRGVCVDSVCAPLPRRDTSLGYAAFVERSTDVLRRSGWYVPPPPPPPIPPTITPPSHSLQSLPITCLSFFLITMMCIIAKL